MRFSTASMAFGLLSLISAAPTPIAKRAISTSDTNVLQLALFLEHLEFTLYTGGFETFSDAQYTAEGFPTGFRENVGVIAQQEQTHIDTITSILQDNGVAPVPACLYTFPYNTPATFVALANMITSVGIGAYIGGALGLVDNPTLLTDASSILPNEARHDAYLRTGAGASPFPTPFDTSLPAVYAYNLAQPFVVQCPEGLPLTLLPTLKLVSPTPPTNLEPATPAGTTLTFSFDPSTFLVPVNSTAPLYIAFINQIAPPVYEQITMTSTTTATVAVPAGISGVAFAVLTTFSGGLNTIQLSSFGTLAGPAEVVLS